MIPGQKRVFDPLFGGDESRCAYILGFRTFEYVKVDSQKYECVWRKLAGMRVTSAHTIDNIRFMCQQEDADVDVLPRVLLQRMMLSRLLDNGAGAGETGILVSALNSTAPVLKSEQLLGSIPWMRGMKLILWIMAFSLVATRARRERLRSVIFAHAQRVGRYLLHHPTVASSGQLFGTGGLFSLSPARRSTHALIDFFMTRSGLWPTTLPRFTSYLRLDR